MKNKDSIRDALLKSMEAFYNINMPSETDNVGLLVARCDYFERSEKFMISQKANLWTANCEEFLYIFETDFLTQEKFNQCMAQVDSDWKDRAKIGAGHMYTYVTPVFICDSAEPIVISLVKKCKIYKSFKFSFNGWMEYHTALVDCEKNEIFSNKRGKCVKKMIQKVINRV